VDSLSPTLLAKPNAVSELERGQLLESIEHSPHRFDVELGLIILRWGEEKIIKTNNLVGQITRRTDTDRVQPVESKRDE